MPEGKVFSVYQNRTDPDAPYAQIDFKVNGIEGFVEIPVDNDCPAIHTEEAGQTVWGAKVEFNNPDETLAQEPGFCIDCDHVDCNLRNHIDIREKDSDAIEP